MTKASLEEGNRILHRIEVTKDFITILKSRRDACGAIIALSTDRYGYDKKEFRVDEDFVDMLLEVANNHKSNLEHELAQLDSSEVNLKSSTEDEGILKGFISWIKSVFNIKLV